MKVARIGEKKILIYTLSTAQKKDETKKKNKNPLPKTNKASGRISKKAQARLKKAITTVIEAYNYQKRKTRKKGHYYQEKLTFVTLTLCASQFHTDYHIRRYLLTPFIAWLKKNKKVTTYVWRAEVQGNGNIHFHILINRQIGWKIIRNVWNSLLRKEGYVALYTEKFSKMTKEEYIMQAQEKGQKDIGKIVKAYKTGVREKWENPNSTDIKQVYDRKNLCAYITKYMAKNTENAERAISGHLWGKSEILESCNMCETVVDTELETFIRCHRDTEHVLQIEEPYFSMYYFLGLDYEDFPAKLRRLYEKTQQENYEIMK